MEFVTVTAVIPTKGSLFSVCTDYDEMPVTLDYEIVYLKGITQGRKYTPSQWEEILQSEMQRKARNTVLNLLAGRDMTSGALYKKLCERGIDPKTAAKTVSRCIELGEVNDIRYAQKAAEYCLSTKRYGAAKAYQWMLQKGIPAEIAKEALNAAADEVDTTAQITHLLERRYAAKLLTRDYRQKQNVIAALSRRGYRIGEIQTAIAQFLEDNPAKQEEY